MTKAFVLKLINCCIVGVLNSMLHRFEVIRHEVYKTRLQIAFVTWQKLQLSINLHFYMNKYTKQCPESVCAGQSYHDNTLRLLSQPLTFSLRHVSQCEEQTPVTLPDICTFWCLNISTKMCIQARHYVSKMPFSHF